MFGWAGLAGVVFAWDVLRWRRDKSTLSEDWGQWLSAPATRRACTAGWVILTAHLWASRLPYPLNVTWRFPERKKADAVEP